MQEQVVTSDVEPRIANLRTAGLKQARESWDAALFAYGMGVAVLRTKVLVAPVESSDYDCVVAWAAEGATHFRPVQLKEWVPPELNPDIALIDVLNGLRRYSSSSRTVVAIRINRNCRINVSTLPKPKLNLVGIWLFGAASPDQSRWVICGNLLHDPEIHLFDHPAYVSEER